VESISVTVSGRIGDAPKYGTTKNGKPMASFSLAAEIPSRIPGGDAETRWYKVWTFGALASHIADSLVKGDRVTVRADDITYRVWTDDSSEARPRAQVELKAYDVAASMRFDNLVTMRASRNGAGAGGATQGEDPWADGGQVAQDTPEVLNGVLASAGA
jgi:single-strand DNA-binding protein